jgi:GNAT superfamily N-acetyltransferase
MGRPETEAVRGRSDLEAFVALPYGLHRSDPGWTPMLRRDVRAVLDTARNPLFEHAERELFLARRGGCVVGRIAAIHDRLHDETRSDRAGSFGFFESVFAGFREAKDLLAFQNTHTTLPERLVAATDVVRKRHGVTCRRIDMRRFAEDVALIRKLFNAGWERNWGYVPLTDGEVEHLASPLKPLVVPDLVVFAEREGEPIGFAAAVPDFNVALRANPSGRLFPGILKVLWASRRITRLRVMLLGVLPEWQGRAVDALLYRRIWENGRARGYDWAEAGWILEDNHAMINGLTRMGFEAYETYRVYERPI